MVERKVPFMKNTAGGVLPDGSGIFLDMSAKDGTSLSVAMTAKDATRLTAFLIGLAQQHAARFTPHETTDEAIEVQPIQVAQFGVGRGRADTEAMLTFALGPLTLAFCVDLQQLVTICVKLPSITAARPDKPKAN